MAHPVDSYVGQRVRERRRMVGMTQEQLADKLGIKFQQVQKYETGANRVSASRIWDIAREMDVTVSYFFQGLDRELVETGDTRDELLQDKEALALVRAYFAMPQPQRQRLFDLARVLNDAA